VNEPFIEKDPLVNQDTKEKETVVPLSLTRLVIYINLSVICQQALSGVSKELMVIYSVTNFELLAFRSLFISITSLISLKYAGVDLQSATVRENRGKLLLTGLLFVSNNLLMNVAVQYLPIAVANIIFQTRQFCLLLMGYCILRETLTMFEVIAMVFSFAAVVLIALNDPNSENDSPYSATKAEYTFGIIASVINVLCVSFWTILVRQMQAVSHHVI